MAINKTPILKKCRALDLNPIYLGVNKKSNRNLSDSKKFRKISEYGLQLREKQKAKFIYGVLEKPFRNYYKKAEKMQGIAGVNLMILLEMRLDNVIFRLGLARTRREARQIVDHKYVSVNGKTVNIPSYSLKVNDKIEINQNKRTLERCKSIIESNSNISVPSWISLNSDKFGGEIKRYPTREEIDSPINETLIVELYSK